jgi:hypothetical protein
VKNQKNKNQVSPREFAHEHILKLCAEQALPLEEQVQIMDYCELHLNAYLLYSRFLMVSGSDNLTTIH